MEDDKAKLEDVLKYFEHGSAPTFSRSTVYAKHGMVASSQPLASDAGLTVLKNGGNAVDAAVAMAACLAVTEPCSTGIGGDAFLLFFDAASGEVRSLNGSGRSAKQSSLEEVRKTQFDETSTNWSKSTNGQAVTVPGAVDAWECAVKKWGTMAFSDVLKPAIQLAEEGFPVAPKTAWFWQMEEPKLKNTRHGHELLVDGKNAPRAGEMFRNPGMAKCLKLIAEKGAKGFYTGEIAERICNAVQDSGGTLSLDDLAEHESTFPMSIRTNYRGVDVYEHPPNGQGLCALLGLNLLRSTPVQHGGVPYKSAQRLHYQIECMRLAFADARHFICDMDSEAPTPIEALLSEDYTKERRKLLKPDRASKACHGTPLSCSDTVSFQVVDQFGNAVSMVNSNYEGFGSGIVPESCGFTLQNRGSNFSLEPGHFNVYAPKKRPYHTIIPAMCVIPMSKGPDRLFCSLTNMGGFMQPQGHLQILSNILDYNMSPQEALDAPRFCISDGEGACSFEEGMSPDVVEELKTMGHNVASAIVVSHERSLFGRAQIIMKNPLTGVLQGASDGRSDGFACGY